MGVRSMNKVMLIGNLARDPEVRHTNSGVPVCALTVATNRRWKGKNGEYQEAAEFHSVSTFGGLANICAKILAKGMKVYIEGGLRYSTYELTVEDGSTRKIKRVDIRATDVMLLNDKGRDGAGLSTGDDSGSGGDDGSSSSSGSSNDTSDDESEVDDLIAELGEASDDDSDVVE